MCPDLGFRKHDPCNRRTVYPQVRELCWWIQGAEGRVEDVKILCKDLPRYRCKRFIIIVISSLLAITRESGGIFSNANLITLCLSSEASHPSKDRSQSSTTALRPCVAWYPAHLPPSPSRSLGPHAGLLSPWISHSPPSPRTFAHSFCLELLFLPPG